MSGSPYAVVLVPSTSHAIRGERALNMAGITSKLIPVPRTISSECGVCLRIAHHDRGAVKKALNEARVPIHRIVDV